MNFRKPQNIITFVLGWIAIACYIVAACLDLYYISLTGDSIRYVNVFFYIIFIASMALMLYRYYQGNRNEYYNASYTYLGSIALTSLFAIIIYFSNSGTNNTYEIASLVFHILFVLVGTISIYVARSKLSNYSNSNTVVLSILLGTLSVLFLGFAITNVVFLRNFELLVVLEHSLDSFCLALFSGVSIYTTHQLLK